MQETNKRRNRNGLANSRRGFLKKAGAVTTVGGFMSTAGCLSGGDGGGNGGDTTGTAGQAEMTEFTVSAKPSGLWTILTDIIQAEELPQEYLEPVGADVTYESTWEDVTQFIAGNHDIGSFSSLEASRIGPNEDIDLTVFTKGVRMTTGPCVKRNGPYDPANTGSKTASIDKLVEDQEPFGIAGWGGGEIPGTQIIMDQEYGYRFAENENDFNVVTVEYFAMGQQITEDNVAAAQLGPAIGGAPSLFNEEVTSLYWLAPEMERVFGYSDADFTGNVVRTEFIEDHPDVAQAYHDMHQEALDILWDDPVGQATVGDRAQNSLNADNEEMAEWLIQFMLQGEGPEHLDPPSVPMVYQDGTCTDEWISAKKDYLSQVADLGLTNENFEDYVTWENLG